MSGTVRVELGCEEYGRGEYCYQSDHGGHEIPQEQFDRWEAATAAYGAMQAEIDALTEPARQAREEAQLLAQLERNTEYAARARALIDAARSAIADPASHRAQSSGNELERWLNSPAVVATRKEQERQAARTARAIAGTFSNGRRRGTDSGGFPGTT